MKNIIACENVFDDCLKLGENKGWDLEYHEVLGEKRYVAVKENLRVVGNNPIEMLGLLVLAENAKIKPIKQIKRWWGEIPYAVGRLEKLIKNENGPRSKNNC